MEKLFKQTDAMMEMVSSLDYLARAAYNIESSLGESDRSKADETGEFCNGLDPVWDYFCNVALEKAKQLGVQPFSGTAQEAANGLYDNYFHLALSLALAGDTYIDTPALAWAAFNKHQYRGFKDEIACVRLLTWAGFNPDAQDENGMTALHYMAFWQHPPYSHPRGVRTLLDAGANPNLQNFNGDTPLLFMAGMSPWQDSMTLSAAQLLGAGADVGIEANDGATLLNILGQVESQSPDPRRQEVIEFVEQLLASA